MLILRRNSYGNVELLVDGCYCGMIYDVKLVHRTDDPSERYIAIRRKREVACFWVDPGKVSIKEE